MLFWVDFETTGLDPVNDHILEVAWTFTDDKLNDLYDPPRVGSTVIEPSVDAFARLRQNSYVLKMHEDSGLAQDLMLPNTYQLKEVESAILYSLRAAASSLGLTEPVYLAGASVHFDLAFIRTWMPRLADRVSHRVYDTSTLKAFFGEFIEHDVENTGKHRAKNDVEECLAIARFYRNVALAAVNAREN